MGLFIKKLKIIYVVSLLLFGFKVEILRNGFSKLVTLKVLKMNVILSTADEIIQIAFLFTDPDLFKRKPSSFSLAGMKVLLSAFYISALVHVVFIFGGFYE